MATVRWKDKTDIATLADGDRMPVTDVDDTNTDKYTTPAEIRNYVQANITVDGIDVNPGSDIDADLVTVVVTGSPTFSWDESADSFRINKSLVVDASGNGDVTHTIAGTSVVSQIELHSEGTGQLGGLTIHRHTDNNNFGGHLLFLRSDGDHATPTLVDDGDTLGRMIGTGYDGADYEMAGEIRFVVDGTAASNDMPGALDFYTNAGSQTLTRRVRMRADGSVEIVAGPLVPSANDGAALGSASLAWSDLFLAGTIELGHASDTTLSRSSAGVVAVEGSDLAKTEPGVNPQTGTSYTLALTDKGGIVTMSNASANVLTIPTNATVAFPTNTIINVIMLGAGTTSITGATGVTVNGVSAGSGDIQTQYQGVSLLKIATNTWIASGDIGTVT